MPNKKYEIKMRVLFISMPPFLDVDLSLVNHLSKHCDVHYLMDLPPYYLTSSALKITKIKPQDEILSASEYPELHQFASFIGLNKWHVINRTSPKKFALSNLKLQFEIRNFIENLNPDVIHCGNYLDENFYLFLLRNKRKIVLTVHDPFPHSGEGTKRKSLIFKFNFAFIKNIVLLNSTQKEAFIESTPFNFSSVFVSALGVYEYLSLYKINQTKSDAFKILFFGRVSPYKGIDILLEAFSSIGSPVNAELIIAGNGKFWFDITKYSSTPRITILNRYVPNDELVQLLSQASVVVCPYKDATQSGVVMSAYALNKPVIGTKVGAIPEMIQDEHTGILIPPNDVDELANALRRVIGDSSLLAKMENNIKETYSTGEKGWERITLDLSSHYLTL
ncbi:glycosyltransferase family 4 protein [Dyadobacter pollutisoli]|jgi:glycosyltransferase involved in cell wall biosynthesis|uniref:Glycosyltransferase family 4 protein n=1 Tax=Dyadobacter pollutisoli TaxID=2910158 RepID=A0A9E8NAV3_9BACT|nr:glycosyltransferase family 4 protein [Dyadobacter pollutisoli]WAC13225.1 glycosyltransferase family 4 protein [Dyadobacter pollutisoli]